MIKKGLALPSPMTTKAAVAAQVERVAPGPRAAFVPLDDTADATAVFAADKEDRTDRACYAEVRVVWRVLTIAGEVSSDNATLVAEEAQVEGSWQKRM